MAGGTYASSFTKKSSSRRNAIYKLMVCIFLVLIAIGVVILLVRGKNAKDEPEELSNKVEVHPQERKDTTINPQPTKEIIATNDPNNEIPDVTQPKMATLSVTHQDIRQPLQTTKSNSFNPTIASTNQITTEKDKVPETVTLCNSVECKSSATRMINLMNHSIDPCNDFYDFTCGGISTNHANSDTWKWLSEELHLINGTASPYLQTFKTFYDSCVSHEYHFNYQDRIDKVLKLVGDVGKIYHEQPPRGTIDLTDLFANLILRQSFPYMDIDIDIDSQTSEFILKLSPPTHISTLMESDKYLHSVETVVRNLGFYSHLIPLSANLKIWNLKHTIEWSILNYLNNLPSQSTIRGAILFKNYMLLTISDFQIKYPFLQWNKLFSKVTGRALEDNTKVQVYYGLFLDRMFRGLTDTNDWTLNNALVAIYANYLYENFVLPQAKHNRENYCFKLTSKMFPDISSNLYMKKLRQTEIKKSEQFLSKLLIQLKKNLKSILQKELSETLLPATLLKLDAIKLIFNTETNSYNKETVLNNTYRAVTITTGLQENFVKMLEINTKRRFGLVGRKYSPDLLWSNFLNVYDTVPTSFYSKGLILAPLGMVKQPLTKFPRYITMAQIGLSLAKEIIRHCVPIKIQNKLTILTPHAQTWFDELKTTEEDGLIALLLRLGGRPLTPDPISFAKEEHLDNLSFKLISENFDGSGELVLPWVSVNFTIPQIFYITVSQEYCKRTDTPELMVQLFESDILPASVRVGNIVHNSKQFSKVFGCPVDSPMNNTDLKKT